ncbi:hypothetical protein C1H21_07580 [Xanthomonas arboricola pv. juglandis]|nr:hypothetical protein C1H21_07580 [Xanthomonas arboricola pv. juglandis]
MLRSRRLVAGAPACRAGSSRRHRAACAECTDQATASAVSCTRCACLSGRRRAGARRHEWSTMHAFELPDRHDAVS